MGNLQNDINVNNTAIAQLNNNTNTAMGNLQDDIKNYQISISIYIPASRRDFQLGKLRRGPKKPRLARYARQHGSCMSSFLSKKKKVNTTDRDDVGLFSCFRAITHHRSSLPWVPFASPSGRRGQPADILLGIYTMHAVLQISTTAGTRSTGG